MRQTSVTDLGDVFVTALVDGDTPRLAGTLDPDVQMRALLPPGPIEVLGAEAVAGKFATWFGNAEQLELMRSISEPVADRLHVSYRLRVRRAGDPWVPRQATISSVDADCSCSFIRCRAASRAGCGARPAARSTRAPCPSG